MHRKESLRAVANVLGGPDDENADLVVQLNGIDALFQMLKMMNNTNQMEQEVLWALSNITAGTEG